MIGGIDIGTETIIVATPAGTTRHRNAVQTLAETDSDEPFVCHSENGDYAIGNAVEAEDGDVNPLFGDGNTGDPAAVIDCRKQFLIEATSGESDGTPGADRRVGVVDRDGDVTTQLLQTGDIQGEPVDPGMAVCYDVLGMEPTALGLALFEESAFATLAVAGIPVATARIDHENLWYSIDRGTDVTGERPQSAWASVKYETLLAELLAGIAADAPAIRDEIEIAIGGPTAPTGQTGVVTSVVGETLQADVATVSVARAPADSPAQGALAAVKQMDDQRGPVPAFAATDGYVSPPIDTSAVSETLVGGLEADVSEDSVGDHTEEPRQQRARHHRTRLAEALDRLVEFVDDETLEEQLEALEAELEAAVSDLEAELSELEDRSAPAETVSTIEETITELEETLAETEEDVDTIQSMLAGLDGSEDLSGTETSDAMSSVATDALQDTIDDVQEDLSDRIEGIWDRIDEIDDELVDVSAQVKDLPDIESDLTSTRDSIDQLGEELDDLRNALADVRDDIEGLEDETVTGDQLQAVRTRLDGVATDLEELDTSFRELDRADPARVDELHRDLNALQETVVDHARRLEGVERTASDLDDRITQAFQDTAKAEALSSLQAEVSRIRESATDATETATDAVASADDLDSAVQSLESDIEQVRTTVDGLAQSSATRSQIDDLEAQIDELETQQETLRTQLAQQEGGEVQIDPTPLYVTAVGLASVGGLAAFLALDAEQPAIAAGFAALVVGPAIWLLISTSNM